MKLRELKALLDRAEECDLDREVRIEITPVGPSIGGTPSVKAKAAYFGFDWDMGSFIITTELPVWHVHEETKTRYKAWSKAMNSIWWVFNNKTPAAFKVRETRRILREHGYDSIAGKDDPEPGTT